MKKFCSQGDSSNPAISECPGSTHALKSVSLLDVHSCIPTPTPTPIPSSQSHAKLLSVPCKVQ